MNQVAQQNNSNLPAPVAERGILKEQWLTLKNSLYPGASSESVLMVVDYCKARKLDPMKKPCHIVPMRVKDVKTGNYEWRDVVMPGIYEIRTTAMRTAEYMGHSKPEYGESLDCAGVAAPEWCELTVYRWHAASKTRIEFPVRVYFREAVATGKDGTANQRWSKAPIQMLTKCAEAAALREAFPDELGGEMAAEEMEPDQGSWRVEYTADQQMRYMAALEGGEALEFFCLREEVGADAWCALFNSFPKGQKTKQKQVARELESKGEQIISEYRDALTQACEGDDHGSAQEIIEELDTRELGIVLGLVNSQTLEFVNNVREAA